MVHRGRPAIRHLRRGSRRWWGSGAALAGGGCPSPVLRQDRQPLQDGGRRLSRRLMQLGQQQPMQPMQGMPMMGQPMMGDPMKAQMNPAQDLQKLQQQVADKAKDLQQPMAQQAAQKAAEALQMGDLPKAIENLLEGLVLSIHSEYLCSALGIALCGLIRAEPVFEADRKRTDIGCVRVFS